MTDREQLARIIDPISFDDEHMTPDRHIFQNDALQTADAILSWLGENGWAKVDARAEPDSMEECPKCGAKRGMMGQCKAEGCPPTWFMRMCHKAAEGPPSTPNT